MLLPDGFWISFTLIVLAGLVATVAAALLVAALTPGSTGHRPRTPRRSRDPRDPRDPGVTVVRLPRPEQQPEPHRKAG
ncbi:hypothetical protein PO587_09090 [Streptomyces gilvifuscus]|uniref:Uncharacterized protein n=1 Tax=Streptomyces gilvifuscus TaxID=1550617 RepID=A0ABT5FQ04_9ACTN|nr:hypothetical protein [Streptomyces gilvifuscus]MDC2954614.1 hypothetical protein [Streptomyces gilvifuscus]